MSIIDDAAKVPAYMLVFQATIDKLTADYDALSELEARFAD